MRYLSMNFLYVAYIVYTHIAIVCVKLSYTQELFLFS